MIALLILGTFVGLVFLTRSKPRRDARFASVVESGPLRARPHDERLGLGRRATERWRPTSMELATPASSSLLILGPTQSGKTSSLIIPALMSWRGPVFAASVKDDLVASTAAWRRSRGPVSVLDPSNPGRPHGVSFNPVAMGRTLEEARQVSWQLCSAAADDLPGTDATFWSQMAAKHLAPLLVAAAYARGDAETVARWIDRRDRYEPERLLQEAGEGDALEWLEAALDRDERQLSSVYATLETLLAPLRGGTEAPGFDPSRLLEGEGTLYLCATAHDQRRFRPLFTATTEILLTHAFALARQQGGRLQKPLLVVLDEAAAIAPLRELDVLAATCASHGITLVTCFQDLAQVRARYGPRTETVVNNHTTRVLLSGLADPGSAELLGILTGSARAQVARRALSGQQVSDERRAILEPHELRRMPVHTGVVISGRMAPVRLRLVPWWRQGDVARRGLLPGPDYAPSHDRGHATTTRRHWRDFGSSLRRTRRAPLRHSQPQNATPSDTSRSARRDF